MSKNENINDWIKYFESVGLRNDLKNQYVNYIDPLLRNNVPIIFDFNHLCLLLGRSNSYLASVVNSNVNHYREFEIPKKKTGFRKITCPYPALMECQYWIYEHILKKIKIHPAAQGFTSKKSIVTNATFHVDQKQFLKIDLKDFFTSIKINRIVFIFQSLGYSNIVSFYLASICCYDDFLPQGSPTSPALSNIVCRKLDSRLLNFSKKFNLRYTRYADDLAFSGEIINKKLIDYINNIIVDCGFTVNNEKTNYQKNKSQRILTGISISGNKIKVPRKYQRNLKQEFHYIEKYGIVSHVRKMKIRHPNYLQSIIGKFNFWNTVEPNSEYVKSCLRYLKSLEEKY